MRRATTFAIGTAAAVALAAAVISSSRAVGQRGTKNSIFAVNGPSPPPCEFCSRRTTETENFDDVSPPALPPGWIATNAQGPPPLWVTSNSGVPMPPADTPPNATFIDDPGVVSDKRLDSTNVGVFEGYITQLTFRHNFNLEASGEDPKLGFDGGVLEVSADGGNTFQDVLDAGGRFVAGGYNRTISTDRGSPIAGRQAWSGNSEGFITSVVEFAPDHTFVLRGGVNPDVRFRWRMASDNKGSSEGWRVDSATVFGCQLQLPDCTPTPTPTTCPQLTVVSGAGTIVPGITDTGNHTDDGDTFITLPFPVQFYDQAFIGVNVSSNGRMDFVCVNEPLGKQTQCLPASPNQCPYDYTLFPLWQNLRTDFGPSGCASFPDGNCGIFTSVSGIAPNRIFNIEWRTVLFADNSATQNFEVRLYENDPRGFDVIYGAINSAGANQNFVAGIQGPNGCFTQDFCANPAPVQNVLHNYVGQAGGTPSPTPTATPSPRPTLTPRPRPSPRPRP